MKPVIAPDDRAACRAMIRTGSLSFHAASRALPAKVRDPALALYAVCRVADDEVDDGRDKADAVLRLRDRLDAICRGQPRAKPADRAFAAVVDGFAMPRAPPQALLERLAWDALGRRYETMSGLLDYSPRDAASVWAMMCVLMGGRDRDARSRSRACDLGLAMQLTNIARDVGEDAAAVPAAGVAASGWNRPLILPGQPRGHAGNARPDRPTAGHRRQAIWPGRGGYSVTAAELPGRDLCCPHVYAAIGTEVSRPKFDSITRPCTSRARTSQLLALSILRAGLSPVLPPSARLHARPTPEVAFLVDATATPARHPARSDTLLRVLAQLEARDRGMA